MSFLAEVMIVLKRIEFLPSKFVIVSHSWEASSYLVVLLAMALTVKLQYNYNPVGLASILEACPQTILCTYLEGSKVIINSSHGFG